MGFGTFVLGSGEKKHYAKNANGIKRAYVGAGWLWFDWARLRIERRHSK